MAISIVYEFLEMPEDPLLKVMELIESKFSEAFSRKERKSSLFPLSQFDQTNKLSSASVSFLRKFEYK